MRIIRPATDDEVYLQFLRSERSRVDAQSQHLIDTLVEQPDLNDISQNFHRRRLLYEIRHPLLAQLPDPLEWSLANFEKGDLTQLRVIGNCG
jgi:hypothetical protein